MTEHTRKKLGLSLSKVWRKDMLNLGSTYLIVKDIEKSIRFYEALLDMSVSCQNYNRWAQFDIGHNCIALWNPLYDEERIKCGINLEGVYSKEYLDFKRRTQIKYGNNFVLNFYIDDLNAEYKRVKILNIGTITEVMYLNVARPYFMFMIEDPDGNQIEITGNYQQE